MLPEIEIPLDHDDPFTLLVAVVLSAQTTDERVTGGAEKMKLDTDECATGDEKEKVAGVYVSSGDKKKKGAAAAAPPFA